MNAHLDMTLRDWLAGMAMQGIMASPITDADVTFEAVARDAYRQADAMLAEREKRNG